MVSEDSLADTKLFGTVPLVLLLLLLMINELKLLFKEPSLKSQALGGVI